MGPALQKRLKKILLFTTLFMGLAFQGVYGQTALSPGDIAIVTVNTDGNDNFDFVPLVDLESGTEIFFSDNAYVEDDGLQDNEGTLTYTAPSAISAGTIVSYTGSDENGFERTSGSYSAALSGDNILTYQVENSDTTYLYGVGWARVESWEYNGENNTSDIPSDLSEAGDTIVNLGVGDNYQYDSAKGLKGTSNSLLSLMGDDENWIRDDENAFSAFNTDFTLVDLPTIGFTENATEVSEDVGSVNLTVELIEAAETAVDVEVAFLTNSSTATNGNDFDNYSTETVSFGSEASDGDTETVSINIRDDNDFEDSEKAVFQLQNNTEGTIIDPQELTLTIEDNDAPNVVINEILYDPNGTGDEFIEFVNNSDSDLDISNWTLSDETNTRFSFPSGTVIPANHAFAVFADAAQGSNFGGAYLFSAGSLQLNNDGDSVILEDAEGNEITSVTYSGSQDDQSITRNPDITGDFEAHTTADTDDGSVFSPGTKVDGTPFGSKFAIGIRGAEGWRMISSPVQNASFNDFFGDFWMQGLTGSDDESGDITILSWDESGGGTFVTPGTGNMNDPLEPGKGYIVYVFEDDEFNTPGIQGGFPKVINSDGMENSDVNNVPVTANDESGNGTIDGNEGWNLLGNPFNTDIIASEIINVLEGVDENVNGNIYVWDHKANNGNGGWVALSGDDTIAPYQGFFIRYESEVDGTINFNKSDLEANQGAEFYKDEIEDVITFDLQLHGEEYYDSYSLEFSEEGTTELDRHDAYKLFSLNPNSINLFSSLSNNRLQKNALPKDLESNLEIPLSFDANGRSSLTFRWNESMEDFPNSWDLFLIDNEQNREIDLRRNSEYGFTVSVDQQNESTSDKMGLLNKADKTQNSRFILSVQPNDQGEVSSNLPESVRLRPNYPNPFNPTTTIPFELDEDSDVLLTVWNMIGQKVATLIDGTVEAGTHEETWNASDMPSGMYIARFEVNGTVFTRKMTLIK